MIGMVYCNAANMINNQEVFFFTKMFFIIINFVGVIYDNILIFTWMKAQDWVLDTNVINNVYILW